MTNVFVPYLYPTTNHDISDSFLDHVARGSVNPGTDYKCAYGSDVISVADGYVADIVPTYNGSGGIMVFVDHDDGTGVDYLHLSLIAQGIVKGARVFRGSPIGKSGASGYGDLHWYGPHLHISIRNTHGWHAENHGNFDFQAMMNNQASISGGGATPIGEDDMTPAQEAKLDTILNLLTSRTPELSYISSDGVTWWVTDGLTRRQVVGNDNQTLVDIGVAKFSGKPGNVNMVSPQFINNIPLVNG